MYVYVKVYANNTFFCRNCTINICQEEVKLMEDDCLLDGPIDSPATHPPGTHPPATMASELG